MIVSIGSLALSIFPIPVSLLLLPPLLSTPLLSEKCLLLLHHKPPLSVLTLQMDLAQPGENLLLPFDALVNKALDPRTILVRLSPPVLLIDTVRSWIVVGRIDGDVSGSDSGEQAICPAALLIQ